MESQCITFAEQTEPISKVWGSAKSTLLSFKQVSAFYVRDIHKGQVENSGQICFLDQPNPSNNGKCWKAFDFPKLKYDFESIWQNRRFYRNDFIGNKQSRQKKMLLLEKLISGCSCSNKKLFDLSKNLGWYQLKELHLLFKKVLSKEKNIMKIRNICLSELSSLYNPILS